MLTASEYRKIMRRLQLGAVAAAVRLRIGRTTEFRYRRDGVIDESMAEFVRTLADVHDLRIALERSQRQQAQLVTRLTSIERRETMNWDKDRARQRVRTHGTESVRGDALPEMLRAVSRPSRRPRKTKAELRAEADKAHTTWAGWAKPD